MKDHPLLKLAGMDIHSQANRIFLPKPGLAENLSRLEAASMTAAQRAELPPRERRAFHQGKHDQLVVDQIERKMDESIVIGEENNWDKPQYDKALREIISEYRRELKQGNIALNSHHREWTTRMQPTGGK